MGDVERIAYGSDPSQFAELTRPSGASRGVVVVIHGGFWRAQYDLSLGRPLAASLAEERRQLAARRAAHDDSHHRAHRWSVAVSGGGLDGPGAFYGVRSPDATFDASSRSVDPAVLRRGSPA